jgi:general stress protein YciG
MKQDWKGRDVPSLVGVSHGDELQHSASKEHTQEPIPVDEPQQKTNDTTRGSSETRTRARRGFAVMDPARVREIARQGGKAAHEQGRAHTFTPEEARAAGRKGGLASHRTRGEDT